MISLFAAVLELYVNFAPVDTPFEALVPNGNVVREELRQKGWEVKGFEQGEESTWVFWNLGIQVKDLDLTRRPKEKMVLFVWEPPTVMPEIHDPRVYDCFGKVFTWDDDRVDNVKFFKFFYPVLRPQIDEILPFEKKRFCTMITRKLESSHPKELYSERRRVVRFFEDKKWEFDLYGHNWSKKKYKNYRGAVADKIEVMRHYKFAICYENMRDVKGYITEKIFDCFAAGVVPVYWGASNVTDYIPPDCFIDRRMFKDHEEMYQFLKRMSESEYEEYQRNIREFLKSEAAQRFSPEQLAKTFLKLVE